MNSTVISGSMSEKQAVALAKILHGKSATADQALQIRDLADEIVAHRILAYVLGHNMSDENNAAYARECLGLEG